MGKPVLAAFRCIREAESSNLNGFVLIFSVFAFRTPRVIPAGRLAVKFPAAAVRGAENSPASGALHGAEPRISAAFTPSRHPKCAKFPVSREFRARSREFRECRSRAGAPSRPAPLSSCRHRGKLPATDLKSG
jgi:hypothetical protein